ncbi:DNA mismatch repair protein MLH3 isoform X3 [Manihot esculenta]|uniref:DNA mismatch repair protein MLH3 isoform X3 n=1 Tax=Manihot esculenta TaxID=3983 RepID=UPI001CC50C29|nr:DNA mismatch repair protein MLH3 isoform X3 [Manihot esculenta]
MMVGTGCGISRDGLVLLGERHVTSKLHHLADMHAANWSFGFRGEALASISDVSLLEIVSKARGRPNGYRKVLKGSKGLYLGVNDDRKDVGTTVVVRDLFYNQPVRRKYLQSSTKKVLDSVKKCVLRISLVHSTVSFKVVDIESEDELLCTRPSSALSLLMSHFGINDSSFLLELNFSESVLKLSGYISGPCDSLTVKAFQYVYINSRFVCKGPIHKLVNHLASRFECLDPWKANSMPQKGKRYKSQACPAYILNLGCPLALYDLAFEPSKTYVEFKDWTPVLNFIGKSIQQLWRENVNYGESLAHVTDICRKDEIWKEDFSGNPRFPIKKCEIQKDKPSHPHSPSHYLMQNKEVVSIYSGESAKIPCKKFCMNISEFKEWESDLCHCHSACSLQSWNDSLSKHIYTVAQKSDNHLLTSNGNNCLPDDFFMENRFTANERFNNHEEGNILGVECDESPKITSAEMNESYRSEFSLDYHKFGNDLEVSKSNEKPFLQSCSLQTNLMLHSSLFSSKEDLEFPIDGFRTKKRRVCTDENVDINVDASNDILDTYPGTLLQHEASCSQKFSSHCIGIDMPVDFDSRSKASANSFSLHGKLFAEEKARAVEPFLDENAYEWREGLGKFANNWHDGDSQAREGNHSYKMESKSYSKEDFISSCTSMLDLKDYADTTRDFSKFLQGHNVTEESSSAEHSDRTTSEINWLRLDLPFRSCKSDNKYESRENQLGRKDWKQFNFPKQPYRRSRSAPPFYRQKTRFISLRHHSMMKEGNVQLFHDDLTSPENDDLKRPHFHPNYAEDLMFCSWPNVSSGQGTMLDMKDIKQGANLRHSQYLQSHASPVEEEIQYSADYASKWRNGCHQIANNNVLHNIDNQHDILDISSGFLHLAGNSLVPESLHRNCLEDAKVLQQVDKKFIPIVAGGMLAVIDQHAADERIRLEELRQKVISREAKTVTYLDAEKELILPEMGYQLLHSYAEQIRDWGWIFNTEAQGSSSFKMNLNILHQEPNGVTLLAVPCILGVNLSDSDLLEFLQQLADTDGSSTMPPAVRRILNFKACRGAIMFGDSLLPSECALIVEELKQTSLCFQCAHGRPTTAPLVNLEELHKQISKLGASDDGSNKLWHGLCRQELSFRRAAERLRTARG